MRIARVGLSAALGALAVLWSTGSLFAADLTLSSGPHYTCRARMALSCENGHVYPICPLAVSREDDLVTGYLLRTSAGHMVHLRLVPMGSGYRYAGPGVWFDGLRGHAVLDWGEPGQVRCNVKWQ